MWAVASNAVWWGSGMLGPTRVVFLAACWNMCGWGTLQLCVGDAFHVCNCCSHDCFNWASSHPSSWWKGMARVGSSLKWWQNQPAEEAWAHTSFPMGFERRIVRICYIQYKLYNSYSLLYFVNEPQWNLDCSRTTIDDWGSNWQWAISVNPPPLFYDVTDTCMQQMQCWLQCLP